MRVLFLLSLAAIAAILLPDPGPAQSFTGDFYVAGEWYSVGPTVARIDRATLKISTFTSAFSTATRRIHEIVQAEDNHDFYILSEDPTSGGKWITRVFRLDPTGIILKTVYDGSASTVLLKVRDMFMDQNGDLVLVDYDQGLHCLDPSTGLTTTVLTKPAFSPAMWAGGVDIDTGCHLIGATSRWIWSWDFTAGVLTSLLQGPGSGNFRYSLEQDLSTGAVYLGTCCGTRCLSVDLALYAFDLRNRTATTLIGCQPVIRALYGHRFDRRVNLPGRNLIYASVSGFANANEVSGLFTIDPQGVITSITTYGLPASGVLTTYGFEIGGSRNLAPVRVQTPNNRTIHVCFPESAFSAKPYVAALGLSGVHPGVPLGDGRMINLNPDALTVLSLANLLPGLWDPGPGVLDPFGRAALKLNLNALGAAVRGIPVWLSVAVLDPLAPKGIAAIAETTVIRLE